MLHRSDKTSWVWIVLVESNIWGVFSKYKRAMKATVKLDEAKIEWDMTYYQVDWRAN